MSKLINCYFVYQQVFLVCYIKSPLRSMLFKEDIELSYTEQVRYIVEKGLSVVRIAQYWYVRDEH